MRRVLATAFSLTLAGIASAGPEGEPKKCVLVSTIETGFAVSERRLVDVDRDGRTDIVVVGTAGEVRVWRSDAKSKRISDRPVGSLVLRFPDRALLAIADLLGDGSPPQLVEMTRDGVFIHRVEPDGSFARGAELVAPKSKLGLRIERPTFSDIARDVNGDGRADLVLPRGEECELWLNGGLDAASKLPTFTRAAVIRVEMQREQQTRGDALSDVLENSFRIPNLSIADVNGDGRRDLLVANGKARAWHLQRADGSFPAEPDVALDLGTFRDTTPEAQVQLGRTMAGGDEQRLETRDLDGDGIPDYVIAHRRKVWAFHGTKAGPQFTEPSDVLRVADDVTVLLPLKLDGDDYPDLLLIRAQLPTVATLLRGLVAQWDVDIAAVGYASIGGKRFDTKPGWKGSVSVRLPAILGLLRNPQEIVHRLEDVGMRFRRAVPGEFDGDGRPDVALVDAGGAGVGLYTSRLEPSAGREDSEQAVGDIFFADEGKVWELDEILRWLGDVAERQALRHTGGGPPYATWRLRTDAGFERRSIDAGDLDGDGRAELVVAYDRGRSGTLFDVVRVE